MPGYEYGLNTNPFGSTPNNNPNYNLLGQGSQNYSFQGQSPFGTDIDGTPARSPGQRTNVGRSANPRAGLPPSNAKISSSKKRLPGNSPGQSNGGKYPVDR